MVKLHTPTWWVLSSILFKIRLFVYFALTKVKKKSVPLHPPLKKKKTTKRYLGVVAVDMALIDQALIDKGRGL